MDISIAAALLAGLLSFLSPCVLPLVPPYLCFLAGTSLDELAHASAEKTALVGRIVLSSAFFVLGFSTVFVALGATASVIGQVLRSNLPLLAQIAGVVIIVMGLHFLGVFKLGMLNREARYHTSSRPAGPLGAYVIGLAFAFGWTPCIGPVLAAILAVAASEQSVARGAGLLAVYSAGLGIPFLAAAFAMRPFIAFMQRFRHHLGTVERTMGGLLVITGIMFLTGTMTDISFWLLETFPALSRLG
ncbi:sulfite exporter TauE/SafE family protein [Kaustia mangrovi]|uniref:Sulfite exporter TauE/SafE family protein n=1 Tax=Kaustia mangrovi TaxID=2593653 RepID=A0A7S8C2N4_9HYPH|nr:cytochrome c biogenesis protein CcdA [Kaustia mangrovi]QPC42227.1 sulfite exporter TauE/SafE family protein [Kaustia mangrovi]